jgi:hypothetical protein
VPKKKGSGKIDPDPYQKTVMIVTPRELAWLDSAEFNQKQEELEAASSLSQMVCIVLGLGLMMARKILEGELKRRAEEKPLWPACRECGKRLHSKGWEGRQLQTLVGRIR